MKKIISIIICCILISASLITLYHMPVSAQEKTTDTMQLSSPYAVLMEATSGTVIYQKDATKRVPPASITKIMTLLIIFDAIESGKITLNDTVTVSEYAAGMGGSQVFLEPQETQTVDTLIKCIAVASANDACVAMAEHIYGSESAFVDAMNKRAADLGMSDTHFVNCCGLDAENHLTTAYDVALMSRELITKYPQVHNYSTIWMDTITHVTRKGESEFGLTNTNKLVRHYPYATGLKTGSTSKAGFCVSATATKDNLHMIAVVMGADTSKTRFADASSLLNYGFANCQIYTDTHEHKLSAVTVNRGTQTSVMPDYKSPFVYVDTKGSPLQKITKDIELPKSIEAPVKKGQTIGYVRYYLEDKQIGEVPIISQQTVDKATFSDFWIQLTQKYLIL